MTNDEKFKYMKYYYTQCLNHDYINSDYVTEIRDYILKSKYHKWNISNFNLLTSHFNKFYPEKIEDIQTYLRNEKLGSILE